MGGIRRSLIADASASSIRLSRSLHTSARKLEEQPSGAAPSAPAPSTRRTRSEAALKQITSLQQRRIVPGALAKGSFPSGQMARRTPRSPVAPKVNELGFLPEDQPSRARSEDQRSHGPTSARPAGQMARAPATLRITRVTAPDGRGGPSGPRSPEGPGEFGGPGGSSAPGGPGGRRGPNLRGRDGNRDRGEGGQRGGGSRGGGSNRSENRPKKREVDKDDSAAPQRTAISDVDPSETLSNGMVRHLLRLQRKEWDRVPYEPKYTQGSFAANELIHTGRELFRGESPPVKKWGPLERRIGVVGMFGAEATLKIRRVGDGDEEPFGQEILEAEDPIDVAGVVKQQ